MARDLVSLVYFARKPRAALMNCGVARPRCAADSLLLQEVHLGELDLLLAGRRLPFMKPLPAADYYYSTARAEQRPDCQIYHWTLRQPLPTLPVPLRHRDADIQIDLGAVFATVYDRAKFFRRVDYKSPIPAFEMGMSPNS